MRVVLDTTVLIDHLRGSSSADAYLNSLPERPACSEITRIEVITGLRSADTRRAEALFALIEWVPLEESIARRAGELGQRFRASHPGIDAADLAVAGDRPALRGDAGDGERQALPDVPGAEGPLLSLGLVLGEQSGSSNFHPRMERPALPREHPLRNGCRARRNSQRWCGRGRLQS